jgi:cathepsin L
MKLLSALARLGLLVLLPVALLAPDIGAQPTAAETANGPENTKLLALDKDLRAAYARMPGVPKLPEGRRKKLPDATAPSFDWVNVLGLTPIKHQGGAPNCVAQANLAAFEWNWQLRNGTKTKPFLSPQPTIDRLELPGPLPHEDVLEDLLLHGSSDLTAYGYTGIPGPLQRKARMQYRLVAWGTLGPRGKISVSRIKQAILEHGPVVTGVYVTPAFEDYKGGVFAEHYRGMRQPTNHAIVIVGWDDKKGKGCWHIQNSWGIKWGEGGGGMWIEYGCNNVGYHIRWMRAQSIHYHLPKDVHKQLGDKAEPFPRFPSAVTVNLPKK